MASPKNVAIRTLNLSFPIGSDIRRVLSSGKAVLLRGERGVGKARLARAIHDGSSRRHGHFEYLDCDGMPDTLVASEIAGHRQGSFPGALRDKRSASAWRAHEGTLTVSNVANVGPLGRQVLSGLIRLGHVIPIGASAPVGTVDVRVILIADGPFERSWLEELAPVTEIHVPRSWDRDENLQVTPAPMLKVRKL